MNNKVGILSYEETLKYHHSWKWSDVNAFDGYKANGQYVDEQYL